MRKVGRGATGGKRPVRSGDRSTKPGFRPKGNNTDRPVRSRSTGTDREEERPRFSRGPRSTGSGDRPPRRTDSGDRSERRPRIDREEGPARFDRSERPARFERSDKPAGRTGYNPADRGPRRGAEDRPSRAPRRGDDERSDRPTRSYTRSSEDRPSRAPRRGDDERSERPTRSYTRSSEDRPSRAPRRGDDERSDRPTRSYTRSSDDRPSRGDDERSERPGRDYERAPRAYTRNKEDRPSRAPRRSDDASSDRPSRRTSGSREDKPFTSRGRSSFGNDRKPFRKPRTTDKSEKSTVKEDGTTRLNKYISNCGICSRREADELIKAGVISVNGTVITEMGYKVNPGDEVRYNNSLLRGERPVYLLLNKPKDFITTVEDPGNRRTVMELISGACKERVYPVGRLDRNTTGVLLFTNDGDLARKLMHPSFEVQKVYHVSLDKTFKPDDMEKVLEGIHLEDGPIKADDIAYAGDGDDRKQIGIELHSGRNRIVRRIFEHFGHEVEKLDRTVFAGLTKKDLPRGRWRFLTPLEVANLKMMVGEKRYREAMRDEQ